MEGLVGVVLVEVELVQERGNRQAENFVRRNFALLNDLTYSRMRMVEIRAFLGLRALGAAAVELEATRSCMGYDRPFWISKRFGNV